PEVILLGDKLASFSPHVPGKRGRKFGLIHHSGEILLPAEFDEIQQFGDYIFIRLGDEVQMFDLEGKFVQQVSAMPG
ncbi:MAG: WG repeat-containing protein, partial [Bacteroidetes bacterium]